MEPDQDGRPQSNAETLSDSEPSDCDEGDLAETMVFYKTKAKGGGQKALHIPSEAELKRTACARALLLQDLVSVSFDANSWKETAQQALCNACIKARPAVYPDVLVQLAFPQSGRPGATTKATPKKPPR